MLDKDTILAFAEAINAGRRAFDLPDVETWDITASQPGSLSACLSARHLLGPIEFETPEPHPTDRFVVGCSSFGVAGRSQMLAPLAQALHAESDWNHVVIPDAIKAVTDVFDDFAANPESAIPALLDELRFDFIAAGLDAE